MNDLLGTFIDYTAPVRMTIAAFHKDQGITNTLSIVIGSHIHSCRQGREGRGGHDVPPPFHSPFGGVTRRARSDRNASTITSVDRSKTGPSVRPSGSYGHAAGRAAEFTKGIYGELVAER